MTSPLTRPDRTRALAQAGYNVLNLDPVDIEHDLLSDVPPLSFVPAVRDAGLDALTGRLRAPPLDQLATQLYGPGHYVFATKGRAGEDALADVFGRTGEVLISNGAFITMSMAFQRRGMRTEVGPRRVDGSADVDLAWLDERIMSGGVGLVCLEPCNNQQGGWPLHLDNAVAVRELCQRKQIPVLIDATRVLTNFATLGRPVLESTRQLLTLADAFVVSCAKELLVPCGGLVCVREPALQAQIFDYCFMRGTVLEPVDAAVRLAEGMRQILADVAPVTARRAQVQLLAQELRFAKAPLVEPTGGHAVYVDVSSLMEGREPVHARALEALLYERGGVRTMIARSDLLGRFLMRLPLTMAGHLDADVRAIAQAVRELFYVAREAPSLTRCSGNVLHPFLSRFEVLGKPGFEDHARGAGE